MLCAPEMTRSRRSFLRNRIESPENDRYHESSGDAVSAGCYMVVVEQGDTEVTRKVVELR